MRLIRRVATALAAFCLTGLLLAGCQRDRLHSSE